MTAKQYKNYPVAKKNHFQKGISLLEVLVSISIIMLLMGIMLPVVQQARQKARSIRTMNNQRQIIVAVSAFSLDNDEKYPESVAKIGTINNWNWQEPTMMTSIESISRFERRSISAYLYTYISDVRTMTSPNAPGKYGCLQEAWDAGDAWDNPQTLPKQDSWIGTYCFYWNYIGYLEEQDRPFKGPIGVGDGSEQSDLLVTDYFGYNHWRNPDAYQSCEKFRGASVVRGTWVCSDLWSRRGFDNAIGLETLNIELHAGYTDGHVELYSPLEVIPMKVSITTDGKAGYPDVIGPGIFYLPADAL